jgi:HTH-like domain
VRSFEAIELDHARRTIAELEAELEITKAATAIFDGQEAVGPKAVPGCPSAEQRGLLGAGVSRSAYYEFKCDVPSDREMRHLLGMDLVKEVHERSRGTYGMLRVTAALRREHDMAVNRAARLVESLGSDSLLAPHVAGPVNW